MTFHQALEHLYYFLLLALLAEILGTVGGFGSSLFFVPMAGFFLDFYSVLGITALFHVSSNVVKIFFFRKGFDRKLIVNIGVPAVLFVIAGAYLSQFIDKKILEFFLSLFLIAISLFLLFSRNIQIKPNIANSVLGGGVSGFIAGLLGTGGAIRGLTLAAFNLEKEVFIATSAIIDLGIDFSRSVVYFSNGYMKKEFFSVALMLLGVSIAGTFIGKKILMRITERQFRSFVLLMILGTGLATLIRFLLSTKFILNP